MYPNLTRPLLALLGAGLAVAVYISLRRPFLRRLALRQLSRRRREAVLVITGSVLGTAIIIGSLVVGDTLNSSVKRAAYTSLGPVDEIVTSPYLDQGEQIARAVEPLRADPDVDGLLTLHGDQAAMVVGTGAARKAEPRVNVWDVDFGQAAAFGESGQAGSGQAGSGLGGPEPAAGDMVVNQELASALGVRPGDVLTVYLYGTAWPARVARVVPTWGLAGAGTGVVARNAFFAPGTLVQAAARAGGRAVPRTVTFVSNTGDVEGGNRRSDTVAAKLTAALGPLATAGVSVEKPKQAVLEQAKAAGDTLGSLFLFIGSFAIIAGVLLLVNIFVMLAEERKSELGMLRAIGMKRSRLVRSFMIEGTVYALLSSLVGILAGLAVGRAVVAVAAQIYHNIGPDSGGLQMTFHVTPVSIANGFAAGFLIAFLTVTLTSLRISRVNIIAAIRDLSNEGGRPLRRRWVTVSTVAAAVFAAAAVRAVGSSDGIGSYLFPALAVLAICPLLVRLAPRRWVYSGAALAVLGWTLAAGTVRPRILDNSSSATYIILGVLLVFSGVVLVSENQRVLTRPLAPLVDRPTSGGLAARLAFAYPLARRFRTGAILVMYSLVVFTLVLITVLGAMIDSLVDGAVKDASGGYALRVDFNPANPVPDPARTLTSGRFAGRVDAIAPLLVSRGRVSDLGTLTKPVDVVGVGAGPDLTRFGGYPLYERMSGFRDDRATWQAVMADYRYVVVDQFLGRSGGGPAPRIFAAGDTMTLTDPATGKTVSKTVAGILRSAEGFYGIANSGFTSVVVMSETAARSQFLGQAKLGAAMIRPAAGVPDGALAADLQGQYVPQSLVATRVRAAVEQSFAANRGFFQLMEGFLALGLLVGIAGLGVVMVRAVRERRRTIGVLRALGVSARTVPTAFLGESAFVALEGTLLGTGLAIITSYLLFSNDRSFKGTGIGFSVPWLTISLVVGAALAASVLVTTWPARQASRIQPAVALRITD
jgi:putative ABC transport system permease protein